METTRSCGCKGIRTCLICEIRYSLEKSDFKEKFQKFPSYVYCPYCNKSWPGWDAEQYKEHPYHEGNAINYPGIFIELNFLSTEEASTLMQNLDTLPWEPSQSGRRKQNFGPKCNFKKRKLRLGDFVGFPKSTKFVQEKLVKVPLLNDFKTIEQCTLEYNQERGASIDPHIDDCWIWGERIVTVNVKGDSVLTMTPYNGLTTRYNLDCVANYNSKINERINDEKMTDYIKEKERSITMRIPMPARSLLVLYGPARYEWEHSILREDIVSRRVCLAYREFTPLYLKGGLHDEKTSEIRKRATNFW